jgi:hypothetical protein
MRKAKADADRPAVVDARGHMLLPLGGFDYVLRPDFLAIVGIEQQLGRSLTELSTLAVSGKLTTTELAIIATEMIRGYSRCDPKAGPSYRQAKAEKIARLIMEDGTPKVFARLAIVLVAAVNGGYTAEGEPKPAM